MHSGLGLNGLDDNTAGQLTKQLRLTNWEWKHVSNSSVKWYSEQARTSLTSPHFLFHSLIFKLTDVPIKWTDGIIFVAVKEKWGKRCELYNSNLVSHHRAVSCFSPSFLSETASKNNGGQSCIIHFNRKNIKEICSNGEIFSSTMLPWPSYSLQEGGRSRKVGAIQYSILKEGKLQWTSLNYCHWNASPPWRNLTCERSNNTSYTQEYKINKRINISWNNSNENMKSTYLTYIAFHNHTYLWLAKGGWWQMSFMNVLSPTAAFGHFTPPCCRQPEANPRIMCSMITDMKGLQPPHAELYRVYRWLIYGLKTVSSWGGAETWCLFKAKLLREEDMRYNRII